MLVDMGGASSHIVYIEGNIGAGKSELLSGLEAKGYKVVTEAIDDDWTLFTDMCKDPVRWGMSFQMQVTNSICNRIEAAIKNHTGPWPIIVERSISSAYLFAQVQNAIGNLTKPEVEIIRQISRKLNQRFDRYISKTIMLQCPVNVCLERVQKRAREGEGAIDLEYLKKIEHAHDKSQEPGWLSVDANRSQAEVLQTVVELI